MIAVWEGGPRSFARFPELRKDHPGFIYINEHRQGYRSIQGAVWTNHVRGQQQKVRELEATWRACIEGKQRPTFLLAYLKEDYSVDSERTRAMPDYAREEGAGARSDAWGTAAAKA